jgi:hypothetical protein
MDGALVPFSWPALVVTDATPAESDAILQYVPQEAYSRDVIVCRPPGGGRDGDAALGAAVYHGAGSQLVVDALRAKTGAAAHALFGELVSRALQTHKTSLALAAHAETEAQAAEMRDLLRALPPASGFMSSQSASFEMRSGDGVVRRFGANAALEWGNLPQLAAALGSTAPAAAPAIAAGGRRSRKSHKSRRSRKSRKPRKSRKSRLSRKLRV